MIYLVLSILCSSIIMLVFRLIGNMRLKVIHCVIFNYIVACSVGILLAYDSLPLLLETYQNWWKHALGLGVLFIALFQLMGKSVAANGIALTTVSTKLSVVIPVILALFLYNESLSLVQIGALLVGLLAIVLLLKVKIGESLKILWLLVLFIGSGLLDALLNDSVKQAIPEGTELLYSSFLFGTAGLIGLSGLGLKAVRKPLGLKTKEVLMGFVLGVPNFGSIYFLMRALKEARLDSAVLLPINHVGIVLLTSVLGFVLFAERLTRAQQIGLVLASICIAFITWR